MVARAWSRTTERVGLGLLGLMPLLGFNNNNGAASAFSLSMSATATGKSSAHTISVEDAFSSLVADPEFRSSWQKRALILPASSARGGSNIRGHFTIHDVKDCVEEQFVMAGRGTFAEGGRSGWNMARVGSKKPSSSANNLEASKLRYEDLAEALEEKSGTVVVNSAGAYMPSLAKVCEECLNAFGLPVNMNLYITAFGQRTSAPPHTDKQDVFVIQTQGKKRWRVYEPPDVSRDGGKKTDPMERGKGKDVLGLDELAEPVIDDVLDEGSILYVPAGWPHTTDTVNVADDTPAAEADGASDGEDDEKEKEPPSVHMTVGVDTHIWGLTYASLRQYCLARSGRKDDLVPLHATVADSEHYWRLQDTLPLGFLADGTPLAGDRAALAEEVCANLVARMKAAEPSLYSSATPEQLREELKVDEVLARIVGHHRRMMDVFGNMYADVAYELEDVEGNFGYLRSQPYFGALEATMEELVQWGKPPAPEKKKAKSGFGGGGGGKGMGGGGGGAKKKKKKGRK